MSLDDKSWCDVFLFYISTSSVYGQTATGTEDSTPAPTSKYGQTKLEAERAVLAAQAEGQIRACSMRIFSVESTPRTPREDLFALDSRPGKGKCFPSV